MVSERVPWNIWHDLQLCTITVDLLCYQVFQSIALFTVKKLTQHSAPQSLLSLAYWPKALWTLSNLMPIELVFSIRRLRISWILTLSCKAGVSSRKPLILKFFPCLLSSRWAAESVWAEKQWLCCIFPTDLCGPPFCLSLLYLLDLPFYSTLCTMVTSDLKSILVKMYIVFLERTQVVQNVRWPFVCVW